MSRNNKKNTVAVATQASEILISGLAEMTTELKTKKKLVKTMDVLKAWETATKARNPQYVVGSLRATTEADLAVVGHSYGFVGLIKCEVCGQERLVNKQDAFQTRTCKVCKRAAAKATAKTRATARKLAGMTREDLQAKIDALNAQLATKAA